MRSHDVDKHEVDMVDTGKHDRKGNKILKPLVVTKHNELKVGIHMADQMSAYNSAVKISVMVLQSSRALDFWYMYCE